MVDSFINPGNCSVRMAAINQAILVYTFLTNFTTCLFITIYYKGTRSCAYNPTKARHVPEPVSSHDGRASASSH